MCVLLSLTACSERVVDSMSRINELTAVDSLNGGDNIPVFDTSNGDTRRASVTTLQEYMQDNLEFDLPDNFTTQYEQPGGFGFSVTLTGSDNIFLILQGSSAEDLGFNWFLDGNVVDKQEVLVSTVDIINAGLAFAITAPTTVGWPAGPLAAGDFYKMRYDAQTATWYRVG